MIDVNQEYTREVECEYKDDIYKVRDNGAIMRMPRIGKTKRPKDERWTFGETIDRGYAKFCGEPVHRIVAFAFHGAPPTSDHVVDHIDTNRQNNRPENLRWVTRLENILLNPITKAKIEMLCGSVESFLEDPTQLYGHEADDSIFKWMKPVTKAQAQNALINWQNYLSKPRPTTERSTNAIEEWILSSNKPMKEVESSFELGEPGKDSLSQDVLNGMIKNRSYVEIKTFERNRRPKKASFTKQDFLSAIKDLCKHEGWAFLKNYNEEGWKVDVLISDKDNRVPISIYRSSLTASDELKQLAQQGIFIFGFILSSESDYNIEPDCFNAHHNGDSIEVTYNQTTWSLQEMLRKAMNRDIRYLMKANITAIDVVFKETNCYFCQKPHHVYYIKNLVDETGLKCNYNILNYYATTELTDLQFDDNILASVRQYITEHPERGIIMGQVKERYSKTADDTYSSFGCPYCDGIVGKWYLSDLEREDENLAKKTPVDRITLKSPFEIPVNNWFIK